jgi:hypothetical protein
MDNLSSRKIEGVRAARASADDWHYSGSYQS